MTDPITAAALAYVSKDFLAKLLGPTAEYLGSGLKDYTQIRIKNIGRIFKKAEAILGEKINESGEVPPKVLRKVIDEGSFIDDELSAEYFGGILASSRSNNIRDDRGACFINSVEGLSVYQIRTHYIFYMGIKILFKDSGYLINLVDRPKMETFVPMLEYTKAMEFTDDELGRLDALLTHSLFGLHKEGYLEKFQYGGKDDFIGSYKNLPSEGIIFTPSALGAELFLWAHGQGDLHVSKLLNPDLDFEIPKGIVLPIGAILPTSQFK